MWTLWNIYSCGSCGGNYGSLFNPIKYAAGGTFGTIGQYTEKLSFGTLDCEYQLDHMVLSVQRIVDVYLLLYYFDGILLGRAVCY